MKIRFANDEDTFRGWMLDRKQMTDITLKAMELCDVSCVEVEAVVCALIDLGYLEQPETAKTDEA